MGAELIPVSTTILSERCRLLLIDCGVHSRGSTQERGCDSVCLRTKGKYRKMPFITDRLPESGLLR